MWTAKQTNTYMNTFLQHCVQWLKKKKEKRKRNKIHLSSGLKTVSDLGVTIMAQWSANLTRTMRLWIQSLASLSGLRIWPCYELWCVGHRSGSDPDLLWLWRRPLAWEPPYAADAPLEKTKKRKKKRKASKRR